MCNSSRSSVSTLLVVVTFCFVAFTTKAATFNNLDRTLIVEYRVLGRERIPLVIAAQPGRTAEVAKRLQAEGAEVVSRHDDIGYLYVRLKLTSIGVMETIDGIDAMEVAAAPVRAWASFDEASDSKKFPAPSPFLSLDNPYTAEYVTQASNFKTTFPTFDGRGVVIGFPEAADPLMPSMKGALSIDGLPVPKFASYWWGQPGLERPAIAAKRGNFWQNTKVVNVVDGYATFADRKFKLPKGIAAQEWRMCARGLSTQKQPADVGEIVLWAVDKQQLWVLLEGKNDFNEASTIRIDIALAFQTLRDDDPKRDEGNRYRSWVFIVDEKSKNVAFGRTASHAQMVASLMAGNSFMGSRAGGVAPASQLASFMETGAPDDEFTWMAFESILAAFRNSKVDIVQSSMLIGDTAKGLEPRLPVVLLDRLIKLTNKPFSVAVGNTGTAVTGLFGMSPTIEAFSIGGYTPRETWLANTGVLPSEEFALAPYSAWGPASDGALKPDFLALTQTLCERSVSGATPFEKPFGLYTVSGGTSASSPHGAAHLALLISAAKQKHIKYDVARLRAAIATTAKFLPGVETRSQGYGLIQVADAWEALQRANSWEVSQINSTAIVVGRENSDAIKKRGVGRGLFEASGWSPGATGEREITVVRTKGPAGVKTYQLRWKSNSDAFSSSMKEVALPLGKPVIIPVTIKVGERDSYSAILDLIDPRVQLVAHSVLATVFVSHSLEQKNGYSTTLKRKYERPGSSEVFIDVPAGLSQLRLNLKRADGLDELPKSGVDQWQLIAEDPSGRRMPYFLAGSVGIGEGRESTPVKGERVQIYTNPVAGVWHFLYQYRVPQPPPKNPQLTATELTWQFTGVKVQGAVEVSRQEVAFTNQSAIDLKGKVLPLGMGSLRALDVTLKPGFNARLFDLEVMEGTTRLEIELTYDDPKSLAGLYVYRAPDGPDNTVGDPNASINATAMVFYDASGGLKKQWVLDKPKPGKYVVAIDSTKVPASGLKVHYRDLIVHPALGDATSADSEGTITPGTARTARIGWTLGSIQPSGDRRLVAVTGFVSPDFGYSKLSGARGTSSEKLEIVPVTLNTQTIPVGG